MAGNASKYCWSHREQELKLHSVLYRFLYLQEKVWGLKPPPPPAPASLRKIKLSHMIKHFQDDVGEGFVAFHCRAMSLC